MKSPRLRAGRRLALFPLLLAAAPPVVPATRPEGVPPVEAADAAVAEADLVRRLAEAAPAADHQVLALAVRAMSCALRDPQAGVDPRRLGVIDYSRPSTEPRLWVFDLAGGRLLFEEWVAHGRNSGDNLARRFSNADGSHMTSLGAFAAQETYVGGNGYSLRLRGLEPGFNDRARERAIVIHGAPYVDPVAARLQGRLGRSLGCPAVRPQVARPLIDSLRGGAFVFAYYPDPDWLRGSRLLAGDCAGGATVASGAVAGGHGG